MIKTDTGTIITGTNTSAIKAQRLLRGYGIASRVVRRTDRARGCVYGLEVESAVYMNAANILRYNGLSISMI